MTTTTKSATAEGLPSRRAIVTGTAMLAAAAATGTTPVKASSETSIARLGREWRALLATGEELRASSDAATAVRNAMVGEPPEILRTKAGDSKESWMRVGTITGRAISPEGRHYATTEGLRILLNEPAAPVYLWRWANEALPIAEAYERAEADADEASGVTASIDADDAWCDAVIQLQDAIMAAAPTCIGDVAIKLEVATRHEKDEELSICLADLRRLAGMEVRHVAS